MNQTRGASLLSARWRSSSLPRPSRLALNTVCSSLSFVQKPMPGVNVLPADLVEKESHQGQQRLELAARPPHEPARCRIDFASCGGAEAQSPLLIWIFASAQRRASREAGSRRATSRTSVRILSRPFFHRTAAPLDSLPLARCLVRLRWANQGHSSPRKQAKQKFPLRIRSPLSKLSSALPCGAVLRCAALSSVALRCALASQNSHSAVHFRSLCSTPPSALSISSSVVAVVALHTSIPFTTLSLLHRTLSRIRTSCAYRLPGTLLLSSFFCDRSHRVSSRAAHGQPRPRSIRTPSEHQFFIEIASPSHPKPSRQSRPQLPHLLAADIPRLPRSLFLRS
ncbi:hypothetical protein L1887_41918 [Cichorium endivia]|nr:hypothetical protein L1887_41918 [Cichorium endivia]